MNELEVRFTEGQQNPTGRKVMIKENYIGANGQECESDAEVDEFENVDEGVFKPILDRFPSYCSKVCFD